MENKLVIGIAGLNGSGKSTVCGFLSECDYTCFSLSDILKDKLKRNRVSVTRDHMIKLGNSLRQSHGASYLADVVVEKIDKSNGKRFVIDSIRNPEEVNALKKAFPRFVLIWLSSPIEVRYHRIHMRELHKETRKDDHKNIEAFQKAEQTEEGRFNYEQQMHLIQKLANLTFQNTQKSKALFLYHFATFLKEKLHL